MGFRPPFVINSVRIIGTFFCCHLILVLCCISWKVYFIKINMPFSLETAAAQVQEHLRNLNSILHVIKAERDSSEKVLDTIIKTQDDITNDGKMPNYSQQKLKGLYQASTKNLTQSEKHLRQALSTINEIRTICNEGLLQAKSSEQRETFRKRLQIPAQCLPLWVSKPGSKPPPLCGAIPAEPSYIAKVGDMVAALVENVDCGDEEEVDNWILAEIISYNPVTKKYEVEDIDEDQSPRHTVSKSSVVPLPLMRANPATDPHALFPKGTNVMALYPQTTCFYKGLIHQLPRTMSDDYEVLFVDKAYVGGYAPPLQVPQRFVIDIKDKQKA